MCSVTHINKWINVKVNRSGNKNPAHFAGTKALKKAKTTGGKKTEKRKSVCLRQECVKALASLCDRHRQVLDCGQVLAHGAIAFCCLYTPHCSCISFSMCVCVEWGRCQNRRVSVGMGATVLREPGGGFLTRGEVSGLTGSTAQLSHSLSLWWFSSSYILTNSILFHHKLLLHFLHNFLFWNLIQATKNI